ncbi:hypothetical protein [Ancylobacter defluvii]|uniref:Uncharacterized protein n=1 Tax=Ancylobacter defluvii TaxID=1282440 RepID=A0A9W6K1K4_9HYPH|nr:hypothetical protein [Ancylobacter defluvii]MBS7587004.1 hypothetical protein [Ancylobacter defluvii]GLK86309.1 hypothetical protein GCM10017653_43790 [Ancylobacter defluvii]
MTTTLRLLLLAGMTALTPFALLPAAAQNPAPASPPQVNAPPGNAPPAAAPAPKPAPTAPAGPAGGTQPAPSAATSPEVDPDMQRVAACKERALERLKAVSPSIDDIYMDVDGLTIATANSKIGDTPVSGVIMGEAYIQRDRKDEPNRFVCLTGPKGDVLFTFFTVR